MSKKTAIYIRVSVLKEEAVSPEMQLDRGVNYCNLNNEEYQVFSDLDFSGKDTKRPAFQDMQNQIKAGLIKKVVVYRLDRLSRSLKDLITFIDLLKELGVEFVSITEKFDSSTPMGRAMLNIMGVFAQMEREVISQRIKDSKEKQTREGMKLGLPPFGYRLKVGSHGKWEIKKEEAAIVKKVFSMYSTGDWSYKSLAQYLNKEVKIERKKRPGQSTWGNGEYSRQGWQPSAIASILKNPSYAGIIREDLEVSPKNFKPIVSKELYRRCKEIRKFRSANHPAYYHQTTKDYPLKGRIFCSCGFKMYGVRLKKGDSSLYFWCRNPKAAPGHARQPALHIVIDEVLSYLKKCKIKKSIIKRAEKRLLKREIGKQKDSEKLWKKYQESYQRLQEQYIDGAISKKFMEKKSKEIKEKIDSLKPRSSSYRKAALLSDLPSIIDGLGKDPKEGMKYKKKLIDLFVKKVVWEKDHIKEIEIFPEFSDFFEEDFKPQEEVSAAELAELADVSIYRVFLWNQRGILPHTKEFSREKRYPKKESLNKIKKIKQMLKKGYRLWQIKKYMEEGKLLLSCGQIAKRLKVSVGMIRYRLPFLTLPMLKKDGVSYYDFVKVKEELKGDLTPYQFLGEDLKRYKKGFDGEGKLRLEPFSFKGEPKALRRALSKIDSKEELIKRNPPLITGYQLEKELKVCDGTLRYYIKRLVKPKIVKPRKKLYSRKEVIEALFERAGIGDKSSERGA